MNKHINNPVIIRKENASYLVDQVVSYSTGLGYNHSTETPYRVMFAENGDIIFRPWKDPNIIYHYCSLETFKAILNSKVLHMSDARYCNDHNELKQSIEVLVNVLNQIKELQITNEILEEWKLLLPRYKDKCHPSVAVKFEEKIEELIALQSIEEKTNIHGQGLNQNIAQLYKDLENTITSKNPTYITSFSEQGDVKSQWMQYAEKGKGIAIGFKTDLFKNKADVLFRPVHYYKNEQFELINYALTEYSFNQESISKWCSEILPVIKHESWHEEKEWRLIHLPLKEVQNHSLDQGSKNNGQIVYKFPFQLEFISKIILGPDCKENENDFISMMKNDYEITLNTDQVAKSKLPLQNM
ncbi:DUF2971 domain-containing protein [Flavobacterium granuli]|uniref:DUF2971 domain-containing protein n=1 Tax=Flavobacterium granuli TaxID=280093 RepID=A0ABU1RX68_9FLAO|nr:DUF2971 domain-containing protein [Flavobacterium granuli]MDR6843352.1 hypothetical protein [Flavobacterium granuli]